MGSGSAEPMPYLAFGLALVFSILRLINFAYGELMTITGYIMFFAIGAGLATPLVIVLGIRGAGVASVAMERVVFRPFRNADATTLLLTSFALSVGLQTLFQATISANAKGINLSFIPGVVSIGEGADRWHRARLDRHITCCPTGPRDVLDADDARRQHTGRPLRTSTSRV